MGTFLKIAPQNRDVTFTSVDAGTNITATSASFYTASGFFEGTFSGSYIGLPTSSNFTAPFSVTASKGYLAYTDTSTLTVVNTGSTDTIVSIQDSTGSALTVNNQGITIFKSFTGSFKPTPVLGGIYFDSYDMYIGVEDSAP